MRRLLFLIMLCMSAWVVQAQQDSTYHAFVEKGKTWCVHGFNKGDASHTVTDYYFSLDKEMIVFDGHKYFKMCSTTDNGEEIIVGFFREEDHCVFLYDQKADREYKIYDFTLNVGDKFEPEYGDYSFCEVKKVGVIRVNGETLKTITFEANDRQYDAAVRVEVTWIEGIGHLSGPLGGLFSEIVRNSWEYHTAYVLYDYSPCYLPLSFDLPDTGWHGCQLRPVKKVAFDDTIGKLEYELVPDSEHEGYVLHVFGRATISCSPNQYVYCIEEDTEDPIVRKLMFQVEELEPYVDCIWMYEVDLYFHSFQTGIQYIAVDKQGDHPVPIQKKNDSYIPFIDKGKLWNTGIMEDDEFLKQYEYRFYEDTIINGRRCMELIRSTLMMMQYGGTQPIDTIYVGALYEEDQKVYCAFPDQQEFELLYDFASPVGSDVEIRGEQFTIVRKEMSQEPGFKGNCTYLQLKGQTDAPLLCWMEGIGNLSNPLAPLFYRHSTDSQDEVLQFCSILPDEIIYLRDESLPSNIEVKKQWLDFTHTTKPRPKSPKKNEGPTPTLPVGARDETDGEENLTGEYSAKELFVNMNSLSGTYNVALTDAIGNEVYRKEVQTNNIVALNTDLTKYAEGTYTLTIENNEELYTATLTLPLIDDAVRDLPSSLTLQPSSLPTWTDLSGRRLTTPPTQKGVYIRDGRKILIK